MDTAEKRTIYEMFRLSVWLKGVISFGEVLVGVLALIIPLSLVTDIVVAISKGEVSELPGNFLNPYLLEIARFLSSGSKELIAFYFISRGLIKLLLIIALLKNQLWAYPSSLLVLGAFVLYQLYEFVLTHSILLVGLTLFDLVVMYFIWREYLIIKNHL